MNASVLSGSASRYGATRSRSAAMSGLRAQHLELLRQDGLGRLLADGDRGQRIDPVRGVVLQRELAGPVEQDIDDDPLGRREDHVVDELLVLDVAAVAADELHPRARQLDLEHAGVGGVRQVEAHDLAALARSARAPARR